MISPVLHIIKPALFSFDECLWYLDRGYDDCLHEVSGLGLRKLLCTGEKKVLLEITETPDMLRVEDLSGSAVSPDIVSYIEEWLDLKRDLRPFYQLLSNDPDLRFLARDYSGLRLVGIPDLFEALCWAVIGQQINLTFAYTLKRRLVERYGESLDFEGNRYHVFPDAAVLAAISPEELRSLQFSARKAEYLVGIARLFDSGILSKGGLAALVDPSEQLRQLTQVRGIGEWTAHYALMKSLRTMNSIPFGDAGLNNALFQLKEIPKKNNRKAIEELFEPYAGWQSYLVFYLWAGLAVKRLGIRD